MGNKVKLLIIVFLATILLSPLVSAGILDLPNGDYQKVSIDTSNVSGGFVRNVNNVGISLLTTVKVIFEGVLFIYMIIIGIQMIISMGTDEESLSSSKRQIRYSLVALIFINIPSTLYSLFNNDRASTIGYLGSGSWINKGATDTNLFVNYDLFGNFLGNNTSGFPLTYDLFGLIQILIFAIAVIMIVIAGIKIMTARGKEELITEGKNKIIFSVIGMVLVGFISAWRNVVFNGKISDGANFFSTLANLFLFFAGPVAIFFLTIAGYYLITAAGDEERIKKAKTIVINTVIATLILLASYSFLGDLATL